MKDAGGAGVVGVIYAAAFLDLFSVSMVVTVLPSYLREEVGLSATGAGLVTSIYGLVQFFSSPLVGGAGDGKGYGKVLSGCCVVCAGAYALLGWRWAVGVAASRAVAGLFKHTQNLSRTIVAAHADEEAKVAAYGRLNAIGNVGFVLGPALAGWLVPRFGYNAVFALTSAAFGFNAVFVHFAFPRDSTKAALPKDAPARLGPLAELRSIEWSRQWDMMLIRLCMSATALLYRSGFNWLLKDKWGMGPDTAGYLTSYQGLVAFLASFFAHYVTMWYAERSRCLLHSILLLGITYIGFLTSTFFAWYTVWLGVFVVCTSLMRVLVLDLTIDRCAKHERGMMVGVSASVVSIARAACPALAGILHDAHHSAPTILGLALTSVAAWVAWRVTPANQRLHTHPHRNASPPP